MRGGPAEAIMKTRPKVGWAQGLANTNIGLVLSQLAVLEKKREFRSYKGDACYMDQANNGCWKEEDQWYMCSRIGSKKTERNGL